MDRDRSRDIRATFVRIQRPLRWPMGNFRRRKVDGRGLVGYRFSRATDDAAAGFFFGFATEAGSLDGVTAPPEVVAYVFVEPAASALHEELVVRRGSPVRKLVARAHELGFPFDFHPKATVAAVRHRSLDRAPPELFVLTAADFFMNTQTALRFEFPEEIVKATARKGP